VRTVSVRREDGVVLLLVLVLIVLTVGSVYALARTSVLDVAGARRRTERVRAELAARSGVRIALRALVDDRIMGEDPLTLSLETQMDAWRLLGHAPIPLTDGGELRVTIRDSGSRINLNALVESDGTRHADSASFLGAALAHVIEDMPGREEEKLYDAEELAEAILDWIDSDDRTRLGDEEASFYAAQGSPSRPGDRPLVALGELADVPGIDAPLFDALAEYFTTYPLYPTLEASGVNPNTAPPHVLAMIWLGAADDKRFLEQEDVFRVLRAREDGKVFCEGKTGESCVSFEAEIGRVGVTVFPPLQLASDVFTIESEGRAFRNVDGERRGDTRARLRVVVDRTDLLEPTLLEWRAE
jgi:type II secretory pathway component PulK